MLPDGRVAWWRDATGDERGRWWRCRSREAAAAPVFPALPEGWLMGHVVRGGRDRGRARCEIGGAYRIYVVERRRQRARVLASSRPRPGWGRVEPGARRRALRRRRPRVHLAHRARRHPARRAPGARRAHGRRGRRARGRGPQPRPRRVVAGVGGPTTRLHERTGAFERPAIWDLRSGDATRPRRRPAGRRLPRAMVARRRALLVRHELEGRAQLLRIDLATGATAALTGLDGDIDDAGIRPDGTVWYRVSDAVRPAADRATPAAARSSTAPDAPPPGGARPTRAASPTNPHGDRIQMFVVTPDGDGPFPHGAATSTADPSGTSATGSTPRRRRSSTPATRSRS